MNETHDTTPRGRPSWSGLLQLSLVGIPVKAYSAVKTKDASHFHMLHGDCGQRLRYLKHCPTHGAVEADAIVRGYEYAKGKHLIIDPAELEQLRPARDRALRLDRFVAPDAIDPVLFAGRSLYLAPDGLAAQHAYDVLREVMARRKQWALGQVVLSSARSLVAVRPTESLLTLHVLHFPECVHAQPGASSSGKAPSGEELRLADTLLDAVSGDVDWRSYRDERAGELRALIEAKLAGQPAEPDEPARDLIPLLDALKKSVAHVGNNNEARPVPAPSAARTARKPRKRRA